MDMWIDLINHHLASPFVGRCLSEVLFMRGDRTYPAANPSLRVPYLEADRVRSMPQPARGGQSKGEQSRGGQSRGER